MATRQQVREQLASLFTAGGAFNNVYAYAPLSLQGGTDALCIYSDSTGHEQQSASLELNFYRFNLDVFVKRASAETVEDTLDTLHENVRSIVKANQGDANWDYLSLEEESEALFAEVSGIPYRVERHSLLVKVVT